MLEKLEPLWGRRFYVIGTYNDAIDVMVHEVAHGLFYTNEDYRHKALQLLSGICRDDLERLFGFLAWRGYHQSVFLDEIHAYMVDGRTDLTEKGIDSIRMAETAARLQELFTRISGIKIPSA